MACPSVKFDSHKLYVELERAISTGRGAVKLFLLSVDMICTQVNLRMAQSFVQYNHAIEDGRHDVIADLSKDIAFDKNSMVILNNLRTRAEARLAQINRIRGRN